MRFIIILICLFTSCKNNEYPKKYSVYIKGESSPIKDDFRKKYLDKIARINKELGNDYQAFLYDNRSIGENKIVFVSVGRDAYNILHMLIINKNEQLINSFEVAGDICPSASELEDGSVEWCGDKFSVFENDSVFSLTDKKVKTSSFLEDATCYIDSTVTRYNINSKGKIGKIAKKNFHYERKGIPNTDYSRE